MLNPGVNEMEAGQIPNISNRLNTRLEDYGES